MIGTVDLLSRIAIVSLVVIAFIILLLGTERKDIFRTVVAIFAGAVGTIAVLKLFGVI